MNHFFLVIAENSSLFYLEFLLIFSMFQELNEYLTVSTTSSIIVDKSKDGEFMRIDFNLRLGISLFNVL